MHHNDVLTQAVYVFIKTYIQTHRKSPSIREIAANCYISVSTVMRHLDKLEARGRIQRDPNQARSIVIPDD
jgi:DNA-binding MarR family transcriptional regulator